MNLKISRNFFLTYITEFLVIISGVFVYRLAADSFDALNFSLYAVIRRTVSLFLPVVLIGVGVGVPRYVAISERKAQSDTYLVSGLLLTLLVFLLFSVPCILLRDQISFLIFSSNAYAYVITPMVVMIGSMIFHAVVYGFLRGKMMMNRANIIQLLNIGLVPIAGFVWFDDISLILYFSAGLWFAISMIFLISLYQEVSLELSLIKVQIRELALYGIKRVPGDLLLAGFFAFPAFIVSHISGVEEAGNVAFAITLLNLAGAFFGPVSLLLLPKAATFARDKDFEGIRKLSKKLLVSTLVVSTVAVCLFFFVADVFLDIYLKKYSVGLLANVRLIMFGAVGYCVYVSIRSILDAVSTEGLNTKNIVVSFIFYLVASSVILVFEGSEHLINYAFVISLTLLGVLTYWKITRFINSHI